MSSGVWLFPAAPCSSTGGGSRPWNQRKTSICPRIRCGSTPGACGTDYIVPGADLHRELVNLVAAGLAPGEALRTATLNPALYFGLEEEYGTVERGKVADLVLLDADPLLDVRNTQRIAAVVFNGDLYDRDALDALQAHVRRQARSWSVAAKILWRFVRNPVNY